ncbi:hypothetical protein DHEL01_v201189 [Diaporthe helianthi]|uniref:Cyclopropane-fatty-acyl-phospholipid synthase n=1 Tax=Diaporthe helianthi TaxID=158607 RepID=A0A2P5ID41_DIAHE|nr:hypothetical protein DHEL01_v201189 [Diaporthe helianthi]
MSRGLTQWLSCAAATIFVHALGWDSQRTKQVLFALFVTLECLPDNSQAWLLSLGRTAIRYAFYTLAIFQLARSLLATSNTAKWTGHGKVLLFPSKTTHSRLFPKKHSFVYSYLVVGIPVGWEGVSGGMVSVSSSEHSWLSRLKTGWFHVDPADYLQRGDRQLGLRGKLDAYLRTQVAARFLGYHFNPASFWYLYAEDLSLAALVIEVNNTFDERRMYFLTPTEADKSNQIGDSPEVARKDSREPSTPAVFKQEWAKDFHVSPFNSRKGSYSLQAFDPLRSVAEGRELLDSTITLKSSKNHGKIVARLVSNGQPIDPSIMSITQRWRFLLSWWWVGFVTFPRIVREAGRLWFERKLHVWYRPEPLRESMGRNADLAEKKLELMFRKYLRSLVEQCQAPVALKYVPGGLGDSGRELMLSPAAKDKPGADFEEIEFKVLTPVFYTRFVFYAHDLEALFSELRESCTIWVSRPDILPRLLFKKPAPALEARGLIDFAYFEAIRYLRRRPETIVRPLTSSQTLQESSPTAAVDIRDFRISSMDAFILQQEDGNMRKRYRNLVLGIFVAHRLAFGSTLLIDAALIVLRTWLAWTVTFALEGKTRMFGFAAALWICGYE